MDGHIYYNNNVIKIRYDLLNNSNYVNQGEQQIFDIDKDIFKLDPARKVKSTTPIDGHKYHKFGYLIIDDSHEAATEVMVLPYLHDRKIYLSKNQTYSNYFFTSIRVNSRDFDEYHSQIKKGLQTDFSKAVIKRQTTEKLVINKVKQSVKTLMQSAKENINEFNQIISINLTDQKYHVFQQNGIMLNRVDFKSEVAQYGDLVSTSQNGLNFIFKQDKYHFEDEKSNIME